MSSPTHPAAYANEPVIALPVRSLSAATACAGAASAAVWAAAALVVGAEAAALWNGLAAVAAVTVVTAASLLIMTPWKRRPVGLWMSYWLGATLFRLVAAPAALYLIYSAAPQPQAKALALAAGLAYCAILFTEAAVLARRLPAATRPTQDEPRTGSFGESR
jgi:hypothetical protein